MANNILNRRVTVQLSPVQLIWLHSQHIFQNIQQNSIQSNNQIKFYKSNTGVEIRFTRPLQDSNTEIIRNAKQQIERIINDRQIRLMNTSLHKDIYVRISREARKQFPKTYIIFLHYQTFENCCKKLKDKFGITSILPQFEKLQKDNSFFCFLIAQKSKIDEVQNYTNRILNSQVSCASTTFSNNSHSKQTANIFSKRTMSVSSLRGSITSYDQPQMEHSKLSIHNSQDQQQMFEVTEIGLVNLDESQLEKVSKTRIYMGNRVHIQEMEGKYLNIKKKLYYANRLQLTGNPHIQPIYAYSMKQKNLNKWKLTIITDRCYTTLSDMRGTLYLHSVNNKLEIIRKIGKALLELHRNRQSYGDIREENILLDEYKNVYLSAIIDKRIPPHVKTFQFQTNPLAYDIRQYLLMIYRLLTDVEISSQCMSNKFNQNRYFCTLGYKCKNKKLREFLRVTDELFIEQITLQEYLRQAHQIIHLKND